MLMLFNTIYNNFLQNNWNEVSTANTGSALLNIERMRNNHVLASQLSAHEHMNTFSSLNHENKAGDTHQVIEN